MDPDKPPKPVLRLPDGRFQPGTATPNPGGRPKGPGAYIASLIGEDGEKVWDIFWQIASGDVAPTESQKRILASVFESDPEKARELGVAMAKVNMPTLDQRTAAAVILAQYKFGKAPQTVNVDQTLRTSEASPPDLSKLTLDELRQWRQLLRKTAPGENVGETIDGSVREGAP